MIYGRGLEGFHCSCLEEQLESHNCCGFMERFMPWKCPNFRRKLLVLLEQVWILCLNVTRKCSFLGLCGCVRGKGILGGKGCVDSAFPSVLLNSWALLTEFPCPAWDLAASLENSWIYFTLAILLHSVQIFALTLLVFGRSWPRVSCLIKITWIWNEAPAVGEKFLLAFLPLLSSLPKVFPPALGLQLWTSQISFERADFLCHCPIFHGFFPQCDCAKPNIHLGALLCTMST